MQFLPRLPFEIGSLRFKILLNDRKGWLGSLVKKFRYVCGAYSTKVENTNKKCGDILAYRFIDWASKTIRR